MDRVRIVNCVYRPYKPYWSPPNKMQFSDRIRIKNGLFHPYKRYWSTSRVTPSTPVRCHYCILSRLMRYDFSISYGPKTAFKDPSNCTGLKLVICNRIRLSILDITELSLLEFLSIVHLLRFFLKQRIRFHYRFWHLVSRIIIKWLIIR